MSANPNKPLHIGQARNVCVGDSIRRIYEYLGYTPTTCDYGDDSGVNIGYNIVGHLYYDIPVTTEKKFDHYCGQIYEKMRGLSEDPVFMQRLTETLLKIEEATDPEINALHQKYTQDCTHQQMVSCWRMGACFSVERTKYLIVSKKIPLKSDPQLGIGFFSNNERPLRRRSSIH